ncbi:MAG: hypothetical protein LBS03_07920 [Bacteroidales bacterium]|jgi:hypothetical protein|nr:hypothetical protein [Bacteroidales bacterium]
MSGRIRKKSIPLLQIIIWLMLCKNVTGRTVELNMISSDTTRFRLVYVVDVVGGDTLAAFDSLAFDRQRNILYFSCEGEQIVRIFALTSGQQFVESESFTLFLQHTTFYALLQRDEINVSIEDFQYPQNEEKENYFIFLLIFFTVKWSISAVYIFVMRLPKSLLAVAAGAFLLSAFIDWNLSVGYLFRLLILMFVECGLFLTARKILPLKHNIPMVAGANLSGFGLIMLAYLVFIFW